MKHLSGARSVGELALRALVLGLLVWYLVQVLTTRSGSPAEAATSAELPMKLARWSTVTAPARVHAALDYPPARRERDWLAALPSASTAVTWSGSALVPTAAAIEPVADPVGGADLMIAAPESALVVLGDALGPFDSVRAGRTGVRLYLPKPTGPIDVAVGPVVARTALRDSLALGRLLVLGRAGWEAKFAAAAMEERGWKIDAHIIVSPKGDVRQGEIAAIDTAKYSGVLAVDTAAARYAERIGRYVGSGGGLVLWGPAAAARGLAPLSAGALGKTVPDDGRIPSDTAPRAGLELVPIASLRDGALALERRRDQVSIAARRVGVGRVIQTGYASSWRWRTAGAAEGAPGAHREWLARLVSGVAYARRQPLAVVPATDVAPIAGLVDRLGPATAPEEAAEGATRLEGWIFALLCLALIAEWASRRLRGAK